MLVWTDQLRHLGFRFKRGQYWRCDRHFGLIGGDHISVFVETHHEGDSSELFWFQFSEFHITFERGSHNLHFYYHEAHNNHWSPGGYTSLDEIRRLGLDLLELRQSADEIASQFVAALDGAIHPKTLT